MKKLLSIIVLGLLLSGNAYATQHVHLKCSYEGYDYEQIIKSSNNKPGGYNLMLRDMHDRSKLEFIKEGGYVKKFNITVFEKNRSYELNGVENPVHGLEEMYFVFFGQQEIISLYLKAFKLELGRENFKDYYITSTSNSAPNRIMKGTCKRFD